MEKQYVVVMTITVDDEVLEIGKTVDDLAEYLNDEADYANY